MKKILTFPDPRLRTNSFPVSEELFSDGTIDSLVSDMAETMYDARGAGLAAPQIGVHLKVFILDFALDGKDPAVFVNPELLSHSEDTTYEPEGCLSFPGVVEHVTRYRTVSGKAQDATGKTFDFSFSGDIQSVAIQHENDHLYGVLMIDRMSRIKRRFVTKEMTRRSTRRPQTRKRVRR